MKRLFKFLKGYGKESILGPLFKLCEATLELIVPLIIALIVDNGINGGEGSYVVWMSLLLVLFGAVGLAFSVIAQYYCAKASVGFEYSAYFADMVPPSSSSFMVSSSCHFSALSRSWQAEVEFMITRDLSVK